MSQLAHTHKAINLSQGFPDFECDPELATLVAAHIRAGHNQYAPMPGILPLRETLSAKMEKAYGTYYNPDTEITITAGGTQALYSAIASLVKEGDEVVIFTPAYDSYEPAVLLNGGKPVYIELCSPTYSIDWPQVRKLVNRHTRMIILNTPHNPSGTVLSEEDLKELEKITHDTEIIILSDEVYEHILFDGRTHQSVCRFPGLAERSLLVYSFGKTFHVTGWKIGYVAGPANLMNEFRKAHQFTVFACNTPAQYALNDYLQEPSHYLKLAAFYEEKRNYFLDGIRGSRFGYTPAAGTYFQLLNYSRISEEKDTEYAIRLTREKGLASIPVSVFYHREKDDKVLRFCFAKKRETLDKAIEIIHSI